MNSLPFGDFTLLAAGGSNAALITFLIYTFLVFGLAALSNQLLKSKNFLSEYFLGSRSLGVWAFALTFAATSASGGSFTGFPAKIYTHGWILGLWIGSYIVVPICAMGLLGKRINQVARISGAITVPDVIRDRFRSAKFGLLAVSLIVFFMSFNLVAQFKAGSVILNTLLSDVEVFTTAVGWVNSVKTQSGIGFLQNVDPAYLLCLLTFALAVIVYTTYGGFHAVVWTDVMQGVVMVVGVLIMLPLAISAVGGLGNATKQMAEMTPPRLGLAQFELETPPAKDFTISSPWFTLPGKDDSQPRLFRVNKTLSIPAGKTKVEHVKYVEINTPKEIDDQLNRLIRKDDGANAAKVAAFNDRLRVLKNSQIDWIKENRETIDDAEGRLESLTQQLAEIETNNSALLARPDWEPVYVTLTLNKKYAYGDGERGLYVSGPGPKPSRLPDNPGTLEVILDQPTAEIRVSNDKGKVEVSHQLSDGYALIAVDAGADGQKSYQLKIVKDDFDLFTQDVLIKDGKTTTVNTQMTPSLGKTHADGKPAPNTSFGFLPLSIAISFFFMWAISGAGQPSSMVRLMAFNSATTLRRSIFTVAIYYSAIYFPLVIIFACSRVLLPGMELEPDAIMPQMAVTLTEGIGQGWLAGLLVAAPFAAVMSTVDSFLLMISSGLVRDIYQRNINPEVSEKTVKRLSYFFTFLVGTAAMLGALNPPQFLQDIIVYTGSGLAACFLAPMVYALYWPRANAAGCIGSMLAGFAAHLSMYVAGMFVNGSFYDPYKLFNFNPIIIGLGVSFLAGYVIVRLTPPPPEELVTKYFRKSKS